MNAIKRMVVLGAILAMASSCCNTRYECNTPRIPYGWQDGDITANGIRLHYYRTGDGTKPPMVLLHGYTDAGLCWTDLAHEFENDYDVIMLDYRGHGFSDAPLTGYKTEDYTADVIGFIEALKISKPLIIGHSMGGSIAAQIVLTRPDIPQKAVLIDPPGVSRPLFSTDAEKKKALEWFQKDLKSQHNASLDTLLKEAAKRHPAISQQARQRWADSKVQTKPQIAETVINLPYLKDDFKKFTVPTLILKADADKQTQDADLAAVKGTPNVTLIHIYGAGHLVHLEKPEASMKELRIFLAK